MVFTFNPEGYEPKTSPAHLSAPHMGASWNAVWRLAINKPDKVAALAEARGLIKAKLRWEREEAEKKREHRRIGLLAWKLARTEIKE
jgi:hypothetical protein